MAAIPGIGATTGPQIFGFLLNYMLMGALGVQVYNYYISFPNDNLRVKLIVYSIFVLEIAQTILMGYSAYRIFGEGYGDTTALDDIEVDWFSVCVLGSIISGIVEAFYGHRLYLFSRSRIAAGVVFFLAFTQTVAGIAQGALSKLTVNNSKLTSKPNVVILWMCAGVSCDILIASWMTYYLKRRQSSTLSPQMKDTVTRFVRYTIETGAITAVVALIFLILFLVKPGNDYYALPNRPLAKLYSNNLLVLLNARAIVHGGRSDMGNARYISEMDFNAASGSIHVQSVNLQPTGSSHELPSFEGRPWKAECGNCAAGIESPLDSVDTRYVVDDRLDR